jgi:membrane protease YdiL (CAAX protease family)
LAIAYVRWDLKWPPQAWTFLAINLLLTSVAEEALFRGVIQEQLTRALERHRRLGWLPVVLSTLFFALAQANDGLPLVALVALAGFGYSLVYAMTVGRENKYRAAPTCGPSRLPMSPTAGERSNSARMID